MVVLDLLHVQAPMDLWKLARPVYIHLDILMELARAVCKVCLISHLKALLAPLGLPVNTHHLQFKLDHRVEHHHFNITTNLARIT